MEFKTLGDIATVTKLAGFEFTNYVNYSDKGKIIALRGLNVKNGNLILDDVKYIDNSDFSKLNRSKLYVNDMLFTYVGTVGQVALITESNKFYLAPNVALVRLNNKCILPKFMMFYFQSKHLYEKQIEKFLQNSSMKNLTMEKIRKFQIPVPPLEVQCEIVRIFDKFTDYIDCLEKELDLRKKQYLYYRDKLLTFGDDVEYKALGEITTVSRGIRVVKKQLETTGNIPVYQNSMTPLGYYKKSNCKLNTTFVIGAGAAGEIGFSSVEFWAADDCYYFVCSEKILDRFLYYALLCQYAFIKLQVRKASIPRLARSVIENLKIPVPPIEEQEKIVKILDKFDTLCNDLTNGIPAEINARQKQYKYYRNKLLTFKIKNND
ncbi:MAG: restriction endonuclease subunit S [Muribaculaceae bacterium]|nr:restriction endonuclease subunit S [Muribaculaceae bacterium]